MTISSGIKSISVDKLHYFEIHCDKCDALMAKHPEGSTRMDLNEGVIVALHGGYGMFFDSIHGNNTQMALCDKCVIQLGTEWPQFGFIVAKESNYHHCIRTKEWKNYDDKNPWCCEIFCSKCLYTHDTNITGLSDIKNLYSRRLVLCGRCEIEAPGVWSSEGLVVDDVYCYNDKSGYHLIQRGTLEKPKADSQYQRHPYAVYKRLIISDQNNTGSSL
jgi:hypothetical protein